MVDEEERDRLRRVGERCPCFCLPSTGHDSGTVMQAGRCSAVHGRGRDIQCRRAREPVRESPPALCPIGYACRSAPGAVGGVLDSSRRTATSMKRDRFQAIPEPQDISRHRLVRVATQKRHKALDSTPSVDRAIWPELGSVHPQLGVDGRYSDEESSASAISALLRPNDWPVAAARSQAWPTRSLIAIWKEKTSVGGPARMAMDLPFRPGTRNAASRRTVWRR